MPLRWLGSRGRPFLLGASLACAAVLSAPCHAAAQEGCELGDGSQLFQTQPDPRGGQITRLTTPNFECEGGVRIRADSATAYSYDAMSLLYGSVRYSDPQREMRADFARYFTNVGRLQAQGHVLVTNFEDGSTVQNGDLVYLRQTEYRDTEEMTFRTGADGARPRATVYPRRAEPVDSLADTLVGAVDSLVAPDSADPAEPPEPDEYIVVGDVLFFRGESYFNATGTVEIEQDSLFAYADSAEYTGDVGELVLEGSARVEGSAYDLVGRTIVLASAADGSDEVRAVRDAVLTGEDLLVTGPTIQLYLVDGELEHLVSVPMPPDDDTVRVDSVAAPQRPVAVSEDIELTADSLDLSAAGGQLERIFAAGSAHSISSGRADLNVESLPELARRDWIDADTIEVLLVPGPDDPTGRARSGGSGDYEVERIIARVRARSLYRLVPSDSTAVPGVDPPAVSYIVADQITIFMVDGQADRVESIGEVSGWHLEPLKREPAETLDGAAPADSTGLPEPASDPSSDPTGDDRGDGATDAAYLSRGL